MEEGNGIEIEYFDPYEYSPVGPTDFFSATDPPTWVVEDVLLDGAAAALSAPKKCLSTSVALDLVVSVSTGTPFLGRFAVPQPRPAAYLTGPARRGEVRAKVRAIAAARGLDPAACAIDWLFDLPRACDPGDVDRLADGLARRGAGLAVVDPLFLLLRGCTDVSAASVYEIGATLEAFAERCLRAGATPVLVHHAVKNAGRVISDAPPGLEDMAFAGVGEVVRQWVLMNRAAPFDPARGRHVLNVAVGGSAGHAADWRVTVEEGPPAPGRLARGWNVRVEPHRGRGYKRAAPRGVGEADEPCPAPPPAPPGAGIARR
jgi:replicative DNA helicase